MSRIGCTGVLGALMLATLLAVTLGLASCQSTSATVTQNKRAAPPINAYCPVHVAQKVDPNVPTVLYKGHVIGFSDSNSAKVWDKWPVSRKDAFVARQLSAK